MIAILDYGSGNLRSMSNALNKIDASSIITNDLDELKSADAIILPGVGSFGSAMQNIENYKDLILEHIDDSKPLLGVCLGQQVLLTSSEESPGVKGLDIFKGNVKKLSIDLKIPHMGWNNLEIINDCEILNGIAEDDSFYFVHSYYTDLKDKGIVSAICDYGLAIPAVLHKDNIFSTQFHPEKSGVAGLKILDNFTNLI